MCCMHCMLCIHGPFATVLDELQIWTDVNENVNTSLWILKWTLKGSEWIFRDNYGRRHGLDNESVWDWDSFLTPWCEANILASTASAAAVHACTHAVLCLYTGLQWLLNFLSNISDQISNRAYCKVKSLRKSERVQTWDLYPRKVF